MVIEQRGLVDDTLSFWVGESGQTSIVQLRRPVGADKAGRDHDPNTSSMWTADDDATGGRIVGETDDPCLLEEPAHVHDPRGTLFDHGKETDRPMGRDSRVTDLHGHEVKRLLTWQTGFQRLGRVAIGGEKASVSAFWSRTGSHGPGKRSRTERDSCVEGVAGEMLGSTRPFRSRDGALASEEP